MFLAPTVASGYDQTEYPALNSLPFYINATEENSLKGDFMLIDELMWNYKKDERIKAFNSLHSRTQKASLLPVALMNGFPTSPLLNEGELAPPPPADLGDDD